MTEVLSPWIGVDTRPEASGPRPWRTTYAQLTARQAALFGDREFLVDGATRLTYTEFDARVTAFARAAMALGVQRGDRVAVWGPNSANWLCAAIGASAAGAAVMPMNSRFRGAEAADVITRSRPRLLFTTRRFLDIDYPAMLKAAVQGPLTVRIVVLDADGAGGVETGDLGLEEFLGLGRTVDPADAAARRYEASPDDVADIILTSGTTGRPKGVMTSHAQNILGFLRYVNNLGLRTGERINATLPFFHNFGFKLGFLVSTLVGGTCVCDSTFDPERMARLIDRERISVLPGTPTLFDELLASPAYGEVDLSSLRVGVVAGARVPVALVERLRERLTPHVVVGYGLSELCATISVTPLGATPRRVAEWSGRVVEGVQVRVVDDSGRALPPGEPGEILARGECVMLGYLDDPSATAEAVDPEGWLHTGDIGLVDAEHYVRITDRKKDMFIVGGFNTYPAEIERLLLEHPGIAAAAVVGMADDRLGEVGAAFVVAEDGVDLEPAEVIRWAREAMANYKVPRRVEVVDALPLSPSMKVLKNELRARLGHSAAAGGA